MGASITRTVFIILFTVLTIFWNNVKAETDTTIIALKSNFHPYSFINYQNNYDGLAVELLYHILPENIISSYIELGSTNQAEEPDIIGIICQDQIPENYTFIPIPHQMEYYVFMRKNSGIKSLANLYNKRIIVVKDDLPFDILYKNKTSHIFKVNSYERPIRLLQSGINDCAIIPYYTGMHYIHKDDIENIKTISTPYLSYKSGFAVKSTNWELVNHIKMALNEMILHNHYKDIEENWIVETSMESTYIGNSWITGLIIGMLAIFILVLFFYNRMLRKEIEDSTVEQINSFKRKKMHPLLFPVNEFLFQQILEEMPIWLFINDKNGQIKHASKDFMREALNITELSSNYALTDCCGRDTISSFNQLDEQIYSLKKQISITNQEVSINLNKQLLWVVKYPIQLTEDGPVYILNILLQPFIDGKSTLNKVSSDLLFKTVINSLPDVIFFKNLKGEYLGGNKALYELLGKPERDVIGKTDFEVYETSKAEEYTKTDQVVFKAGIVWEGNFSDVLPNGEEVIFESMKIPLRDNDNEIFGLVGINHDITKHHLYEQQLATAKEIAEESNRIKSSFLANMSHEVRTPMNSIIGFTDLLSDPDLTYDQRIELIEIIQSNGHNLIDLIDDIIDISKIESGQIHLKYTDFNINAVIADGYNYGKTKKNQLNKEEINISFQVGSIVDELFIHSDPFRLRQILKNLFNTAIRYTNSESLTLGYHINNKELVFYLSSNSTGISLEFAKELVKNNDTSRFGFSEIEESSGISLIIAKNIIEMIGGKIWTEGIDSGNPNFYFTIPFKKIEHELTNPIKNNVAAIPDWKGKTILVAEDEETNYILLSTILEKTHADIIRACNGKEAIELFEQNASKIDLILMDIRMPEINGIEASKAILNHKPNAIIIAQTAYAMPEDKEMYLTVGLKGVIPKPIDPVDMYFMCNKYLK